jgi:hypothetical protein
MTVVAGVAIATSRSPSQKMIRLCCITVGKRRQTRIEDRWLVEDWPSDKISRGRASIILRFNVGASLYLCIWLYLVFNIVLIKSTSYIKGKYMYT